VATDPGEGAVRVCIVVSALSGPSLIAELLV